MVVTVYAQRPALSCPLDQPVFAFLPTRCVHRDIQPRQEPFAGERHFGVQAGGFVGRDVRLQGRGRLLPLPQERQRLRQGCSGVFPQVLPEPAVAEVVQQQETLRAVGGVDVRHRQATSGELPRTLHEEVNAACGHRRIHEDVAGTICLAAVVAAVAGIAAKRGEGCRLSDIRNRESTAGTFAVGWLRHKSSGRFGFCRFFLSGRFGFFSFSSISRFAFFGFGGISRLGFFGFGTISRFGFFSLVGSVFGCQCV